MDRAEFIAREELPLRPSPPDPAWYREGPTAAWLAELAAPMSKYRWNRDVVKGDDGG